MLARPLSFFRAVAVPVLLALACVLSGCAGEVYEIKPGGERIALPQRSPEEKAKASAAVAEVMHGQVAPYRLHVGDSVVVSLLSDPTPVGDPYRLKPGDEVRATGLDPADPTDGEVIRVMPDGTFALSGAEDVTVAGRSLGEARAALAERYARILVEPEIGLGLEQGTLETDLLIRDIDDRPGPGITLTVLPDGTVAPPRVGALTAKGVTLGELAARLDEAYAAVGFHLLTRVSLASGSGVRTFVMGEVAKPGMLTTDRPLTVLMAVAMAGGPTSSAKTEGTRVLYLTKAGEPRLRFLDLDRLRDRAMLEDDLVLSGDAVIYVPPSALSTANRYADQLVGNLGFFRGVFGRIGGLELNN